MFQQNQSCIFQRESLSVTSADFCVQTDFFRQVESSRVHTAQRLSAKNFSVLTQSQKVPRMH